MFLAYTSGTRERESLFRLEYCFIVFGVFMVVVEFRVEIFKYFSVFEVNVTEIPVWLFHFHR